MPHQINKRALSWIPPERIEENALAQIRNLSALPFLAGHMAVMPDVHWGRGAPIGSVIPTDGAVVPAAVGVDIGCGMLAVRTTLTRDDLPANLRPLRLAIERAVPMGKGAAHERPPAAAASRIPELEALAADRQPGFAHLIGNWKQQLGTLGGGNHFIEVVADERERVWAFLHSGSRGAGQRIATHHMRAAQRLMAQFFVSLPDADLSYIPIGAAEFGLYMGDLAWAQRYAWLNREAMMEIAIDAMRGVAGDFGADEETVHCHHNFTVAEEHRGRTIFVTRKGAIRAREGEMGLIPGSMGTGSRVVRGLGNKAAFDSAPHGAGRAMGRRAAREAFGMSDFDEQVGHVEARRSEALLDELPAAYKDIGEVMEWAEDLVEAVHVFRPLVNAKGD